MGDLVDTPRRPIMDWRRSLDARDRRIREMYQKGYRKWQIAIMMGLSESTVRFVLKDET